MTWARVGAAAVIAASFGILLLFYLYKADEQALGLRTMLRDPRRKRYFLGFAALVSAVFLIALYLTVTGA